MRKTIAAIFIFLTFQAQSQRVKIDIPETYELSNIILALTKYGISDEWEVQKKTGYYQEVLKYFEPVKNHPLLDSVNYSREKWEDYLSFRTDAVAFSFDTSGKLKRDFTFFTNEGHNPFEKNLALVNDFVLKSNFRKFYKEHKDFYKRIIDNYENYNFIKETIAFLNSRIGQSLEDKKSEYKIILSPLVYRMNCHRNLSDSVVADFPSATGDFVNGVKNDENIEDRLNSNHLIFTEKDHEYINPITSEYINLVNFGYNTKYWDNNSGYTGFNSFNEYMTWAVFDLFLKEKFPNYSERLSRYWQYQNAGRGFFAQNLFSDKVRELYKKNRGNNFEEVYKPLLKWMKSVEKSITLPTLKNVNTKDFVKTDLNNVHLDFSERMNTNLSFGCEIRECKDGKETGNKKFIQVTDFKWNKDGTSVNFKIDTGYNEFALVFNWWGTDKPLISKKGIFLQPSSYILLKK